MDRAAEVNAGRMLMALHPLTQCIIALELAVCSAVLPADKGLFLLGIWLVVALAVRKRTVAALTGPLLKVLAVAAFFLFLMHGVRWMPPGLSPGGLDRGLNGFVHIAAPVVLVVYLSRNIRSEEMYSLLIDLRVPPAVILVLFRTLWLVPRFAEKTDEVITAQKLRGMRIESAGDRVRALIPTLNPILSSMFEDISENSLTMTARGFLEPGRKSHLYRLVWSWKDTAILVIAFLFPFLVWY